MSPSEARRCLLAYADGLRADLEPKAPFERGSIGSAGLRVAEAIATLCGPRARPQPRIKSERAEAFTAQRVKSKASKHSAKKAETIDIRAKVFERALDRCEAKDDLRCGALATDLDHFPGRRHGQTVASCWALCRFHHIEKTNNRPSAAHWLRMFVEHCEFFARGSEFQSSYRAEAERAQRRLEGIISVRASEAARG